MRRCLFFAVAAILLLSCQGGNKTLPDSGRGIYYWKTDFRITPSDSAFLADHRIDRIYLRYFDVVLSNKAITGYSGAIPNASVTFSSPVPEGLEIVPVVFFTLEALHDMTVSGSIPAIARKVWERVDAMSRANGVPAIRQIQIDCDYTEMSREGYFALCEALADILHAHGVRLSSTLRLHQLRDKVPPVDAVALMLYNTGNFRRPDVENSILDPDIVKTYLKRRYNLPVSIALPVYGWGIWLRDGKYKSILHRSDYSDTLLYAPLDGNRFTVKADHILEGHALQQGDVIRRELSLYETVAQVHDYAVDRLHPSQVILYHLDSLCLSRYSSQEIETLYCYEQD